MKFIKLLGFEITLLLFAQGAQAATVSLTVDDTMNFSPAVLTIHAGDTVVFENTHSYPHNIVADPKLAKDPANVSLPEGATPFHSPLLNEGQTFSFTLTVPGTYNYICGKHEKMGMKGQIIVKPAEDSTELELHSYNCGVGLYHNGGIKESKGFTFVQKADGDDYQKIQIDSYQVWIQSTTASKKEYGLVFGIDKVSGENIWMHASSMTYVPVPYLHQYFSISKEEFFSVDCKRIN